MASSMSSPSWILITAASVTTITVITLVNQWGNLYDWYRYHEEPHWRILEDRIQRAVKVPVEDGMRRGWTSRRDILGRRYYHDILTGNTTRSKPTPQPLYAPLRRLKVLSIQEPFDVRVAIVVPSADREAPLECLLLPIPAISFFRQAPLDGLGPERAVLSPPWLLRIMRKIMPTTVSAPESLGLSSLGNMLSYCWGDPRITETISLNDHKVEVTVNLAAALRTMRASNIKLPVLIWVDALCINQTDSLEKSLVVQDMSVYYRFAHTVHAWLGQPAIQRIGDRFIYNYLLPQQWESEQLSHDRMKAIDEGRILPKDIAADLETLYATSQLPYWSRKWIIQEVCLARSLTIWYGSARLPKCKPTSLHTSLYRLEQHLRVERLFCRDQPRHIAHAQVFEEDTLDKVDLKTTNIAHGFELRAQDRSKTGSLMNRFTEMLVRLDDCLTSDPRDAVYSLLALVDGIIKLTPNYTQHQFVVYSEFVAQVITTSQCLDILRFARFVTDEKDGCPSWVHDFSRHAFGMIRPPGEGSWDASSSTSPRFSVINAAVIRTASFTVGSIVDVCQKSLEKDRNSTIAHTRETFKAWDSFLGKHGSSPGSASRWRLLSSGRIATPYKGVFAVDMTIEQCEQQWQDYLRGAKETAFTRLVRGNLGRTLFVTDSGYLGINGPTGCLPEQGDLIVVLASAPIPFVCRKGVPYCDRCGNNFEDQNYQYWICNICQRGNFAMCQACAEQGMNCDEKHQLYLIKVCDGTAVEVLVDDKWIEIPRDENLTGQLSTVTLRGNCYLEGAMYGEPLRAEGVKRFGVETRLDDIFEDILIC